MIPKDLQNLLERYCMGKMPTDAQMDEIMDMVLAKGADPAEVAAMIETLAQGPTREEMEAKRIAEEEERKRKEAEAAEKKRLEEARIKKEAEAAKTAYMNIHKVEFANQDYDGNNTSAFGANLKYDETKRQLKARITYDGLLEHDKTIDLLVKVINPNGKLISPLRKAVYSFMDTITVKKGNNHSVVLKGIGFGSGYEYGRYQYELWYNDELIYKTSFSVEQSEVRRQAEEAEHKRKEDEEARRRYEAHKEAERKRIEQIEQELKKQKQPSAQLLNIEAEYVSDKKKEGIRVWLEINTKNLKQQPFKITFTSEEPMATFHAPISQEKDCKGSTDDDTINYCFVHEGLSSRDMTFVTFKLKIETIIDGKTILLVDPSNEKHNININRVKHWLLKDDVSIIGIH